VFTENAVIGIERDREVLAFEGSLGILECLSKG